MSENINVAVTKLLVAFAAAKLQANLQVPERPMAPKSQIFFAAAKVVAAKCSGKSVFAAAN